MASRKRSTLIETRCPKRTKLERKLRSAPVKKQYGSPRETPLHLFTNTTARRDVSVTLSISYQQILTLGNLLLGHAQFFS